MPNPRVDFVGEDFLKCGFTSQIAARLIRAGIEGADSLLRMTDQELMSVRGISFKTLQAVRAYRREQASRRAFRFLASCSTPAASG